MPRLLLLFLLPLLLLLTWIRITVRFRVQKKETTLCVKILLLWGLVRMEYRGFFSPSTAVISFGPFSFTRRGYPGPNRWQLPSLFRDLPLYLRVLPLLRLEMKHLSLFLQGNLLQDPALTGMGSGLCHVLSGILTPYLACLSLQRPPCMQIRANFQEELQVDFQGIIQTRLGYSIGTVLVFFILICKRGRRRASN